MTCVEFARYLSIEISMSFWKFRTIETVRDDLLVFCFSFPYKMYVQLRLSSSYRQHIVGHFHGVVQSLATLVSRGIFELNIFEFSKNQKIKILINSVFQYKKRSKCSLIILLPWFFYSIWRNRTQSWPDLACRERKIENLI